MGTIKDESLSKKMEQLCNSYEALIESELTLLKNKIEAFKTSYAKIPIPKPKRFTFLEIVNKKNDENFISDYLAFLLNSEKNGFGSKPLLMLLERLLDGEYFPYRFYNFKIYREWAFNNQRRIDILIINEEEKVIVGIENKIAANESKNQTKDYEDAIIEEFPGYEPFLIFLSPKKIQSTSSNKFVCLTYKNVYDLFSKLQIIEFDEIDTFKFFQDFLLHVNYNFIKKQEMDKADFEKALLYLENKQLIEDIKKAYDRVGAKFIADVSEITKQYFGDDWILNFNNGADWKQIIKKSWINKDFNFHFEWWLSGRSYFDSTKIKFMVDIEGPKGKEIIALIKHDTSIQSIVEMNEFLFFPPQRKNGLIFKEYAIVDPFYKMNENSIIEFFQNAYQESNFIIEIIDDFLLDFSKINRMN